MEIYKVSARQYGWIFATIAMGLIGASQLNSLLLRRYKSEQIIRIALLCQSITGALFFVGALTGKIELYSTVLLIFVFLCCQGFTFPNSSALSLAPFTTISGSASALLGAIQMGVGSLSSALVSVFSNQTTLPMAGVMGCCALGSFIILTVGRRSIAYKTNRLDVEEQSTDLISTM
jgi:DHA1 family bicyclomycin/chloramphenicol resistance-like MFS transporter